MPPKRTSSAKKSISAAREAASPRPSRASSKAGRSPSANNGRSLNGRASANGVNATSPRAPPRTRSKTPTLPPPVKRKSQSLSVSRSKSTSVLSVAEKVVDAFLNAATPLSTVKSKGRGRGKKITLPDDGELDEAQQDQLRQQVAERGVMTMADHLHAAVDGSTENQDPPTEGQKAVTVPTHNEYIAAKSNSVPIMPEDGSLPLYHFDEVPVWMQHNPFILTSYRAHYSLGMCMRSLFRIHTETANVWTHLLGLLFFISFMAYGFVNIIKPEPTHIIIFVLFSLGCCLCMGCSACFHLFSAHHCERVFSRMIMMDYFGITSLIIASFFPVCYYAFSCEPFWRWAYMLIITSLGLVGLIGPFFDFFLHDDFTVYRLAIFCGLTGTGVFPLIHVNFIMPAHEATSFAQGIALMLFLYGTGVVVYVLKIPERLRPGRFDVWFHSHQLWHVFVLAASVVHFFTCLGAYLRWENMEIHC